MGRLSTNGRLGLLLLLILLASLCLGRYSLGLGQIFSLLWDSWRGVATDPVASQVLFQVRLPRVLTAAAAGAALALAGVSLQGIFRNPLVDAHVIGVSAGAAFGGTLAIFFGFGLGGMLASTVGWSLFTLLLVFALSRLLAAGLLLLILTGMILGGLFSALVSLLQYLADSEDVLPNIVFWLMGSFASASGGKLLFLLLLAGPPALLLLALRWRLNLLALDEREARALKVSIRPLRWTVIICSGLLVAAQVAVSGNIVWVGLIVPHLGRLLVGADHERLLPCSALLGASYLVVVDNGARSLTAGEIPVSIITALLGAPVFAALVYGLRRGGVDER